MLNFSIVNWGFAPEPESVWRANATPSQHEAEQEFVSAAQNCSYERLVLVNDETGRTVAEAVRWGNRIEITLYRH